MNSRSAAQETHQDTGETSKVRFDENIRGAIVVVLGSVGLIGLAWGVMMVLTSPDGWVTKAANSAVSEEAQLVSFAGDAQ